MKEKAFASGFNFKALGRGGCPLSDGLEDAAQCTPKLGNQHAAHLSIKPTYMDRLHQS